MQYHDNGHAQRENMHEIGGALKDDGVGQFDASGVAVGLDAGPGAQDGRRRADKGTQRQGALSTYFLKVSKAHASCSLLWQATGKTMLGGANAAQSW